MTHFLLTAVLVAALLALLSARPDTPAATTPPRAWKDLRAAGGRRIAWTMLRAVAGVLAITVVAALRTGLYGTALTVAGIACMVASLAALDRRAVRLHRLEVRA
ncbi:hypothetical protein [Acrocarpospora catenulata]|uniref:hypothetical protein n=1 Tax=Acrocarpospora catenulata TaxID=2836182 RepID=UPI001BDABB28|nr:hypothetical protein [Acrocarpospora catenulata]